MQPAESLMRLGCLRFLLTFSARGAPNFGATGMGEMATYMLSDGRRDGLGLVSIFYRKAPNRDVRRPRLYRNVEVTVKGKAFAERFRRELRNRNLPAIADIMDGEGRVAFERAWKERRGDIIAAALKAYEAD